MSVERNVWQVAETLEGMADETLAAAVVWAATGATEEPAKRTAAASEPAAVERLNDFIVCAVWWREGTRKAGEQRIDKRDVQRGVGGVLTSKRKVGRKESGLVGK